MKDNGSLKQTIITVMWATLLSPPTNPQYQYPSINFMHDKDNTDDHNDPFVVVCL